MILALRKKSFLLKWAIVVMLGSIVSGKNVLVIGNRFINDWQHLPEWAIVDELVARRNNVTIILPDSLSSKDTLPPNVSVVWMGSEAVNVDPWALWLDRRGEIEKQFFSMHDDVANYVRAEKPDVVVVTSLQSFGAMEALNNNNSAVPWISVVHDAALSPALYARDLELICRYPSAISAYTLVQLKSSFGARLYNNLECRFLYFCLRIMTAKINPIREAAGNQPLSSLLDYLDMASATIVIGGPPFNPPIEMHELTMPLTTHIVGTIESSGFAQGPRPRKWTPKKSLPPGIKEWLTSADNVVYISIGAQSELTTTLPVKSVSVILESIEAAGASMLWSVNTSEQAALLHETLLDLWSVRNHAAHNGSASSSSTDSMKVVVFDRKQGHKMFLEHASVRAALSHCSWGMLTDAAAASVPVLALPASYSYLPSQYYRHASYRANAARLVDAGAGIALVPALLNLPAALETVLAKASPYATAAKTMSDGLKARGGLNRAVDVIEAASMGDYLHESTAHRQSMSAALDPFMLQPQHSVNLSALAILALVPWVLIATGILSMLLTIRSTLSCCGWKWKRAYQKCKDKLD
jgi:hypothetical protein